MHRGTLPTDWRGAGWGVAAWQVLGTLNRALCTAVGAQNGTRVESGRGRPLPSNWPAIVRNTAMDAHLSVLKALVATNANSPKGFRLMFQLAEALVNNNELCTPDGAKPRKCVLRAWGNRDLSSRGVAEENSFEK